MSKRHWLLALVAVLGVVAIEACSDSDTMPSPPATAGSGGKTGGAGGRAGGAGQGGTEPVVAGAMNENAGQAGESANDAGAAGAAGSSEAGAAGTTGGSAGTTTGGSAGTTTGGSAGVGGTLSTGGGAGAGGATTFTLQTTTLGQVIGTANGFSLYVLNTDTPATSTAPPATTCLGGCLSVWPIYYGTPISVPPGLLASDFGSYDRGGSVLQSTYKGWPLYTYAPDAAVGDVTGEGIGNKWYSVKLPFSTPGATTFTLQTKTPGKVIGTASGFSLYVLTTDTPAAGSAPPATTCNGNCLTNWPIYYGTPVSVPLGLLASDFGSYDRGGSVLQSTYKGWPLYTYAGDAAIGDALGEGMGNKWYTAKSPFSLPAP